MPARAHAVAFALAAFVAAEAFASDPSPPVGAPASHYPLSVRLAMAPRAAGEMYYHGGGGAIGTPPTLGSPAVPVGRNARDAYEATVARMFESPRDREPDAELIPTVAMSGVELDRNGWFAYVEHELVLRNPDGAVIATWRVRGEGRIVGFGERAIPRAFSDATAYAARTFEADFEKPAGVVDWLASRSVALGARAAPQLSERFAPQPPPVVPPRTDHLFAVDMGGGTVGTSGWLSAGPALRAVWSTRTWFLQIAVDAWAREFVASPAGAWGDTSAQAAVLSTGVDVGLQRRLGSRFDIAAGFGAALLSARATTTYVPLADPTAAVDAVDAAFGAAGSVFGAVRFAAVLPWTRLRYRVGAELRQRWGSALTFDAFGKTIESAGLSALLFVGIELPR